MATTLRDLAKSKLPLRAQLRFDTEVRNLGLTLVPGEHVWALGQASYQGPDKKVIGPGIVAATDFRIVFVREQGLLDAMKSEFRSSSTAFDQIANVRDVAGALTVDAKGGTATLSDWRPATGPADFVATITRSRGDRGLKGSPNLGGIAVGQLGKELRQRLSAQVGELGLVLFREERLIALARAHHAQRNREVAVALTDRRLLLVGSATLHFMKSPGQELDAFDVGDVEAAIEVSGMLIVKTSGGEQVLSDWQPAVAARARDLLQGAARGPRQPSGSAGPRRRVRATRRPESAAPPHRDPAVEMLALAETRLREGRDAPQTTVVDVNEAGEQELAALPGIGVAKAKRVVGLREAKGGFASLEEFAKVLGLKPHHLVKLRARAVVRRRPTPPPDPPAGTRARRLID